MDAIETVIATLRNQIKEREDAIAGLLRFRENNLQVRNYEFKSTWTPAQRKAASARAKAQWRKRKRTAQNRAKVTRLALKKNG